MTVYMAVQVKIKDRAAYERYSEAFMPIFSKFKGTMLAADFDPQVMSGAWDHDRLVLVSFPDKPSLYEWLSSDEYRAIGADRDAGADTIALLAQGIES
ncbi:MAG: DUF1330 domain-containing protein [Pseudomonadota bacterium]